MKNKYWTQFIITGNIEDYLQYKSRDNYNLEIAEELQTGGENVESNNHSYGTGAICHSRLGV